MNLRRPAILTLGTVLILLGAGTLSACGGGSDTEVKAPKRTTTTTSAPAATVVPSTTRPGATSTVPPSAPGVDLSAYFMRDEKVGTAHRRVAPTKSVARAALEQLFAGPTTQERAAGLTSTVPAGTRVLGLNIADGTATVDLSREFVSGGGSLSMRARLAQVVFTLTQFPTVDRVAFRIDGQPTTTFGGEGVLLDPQVDRSEFTDVTPLILVESVAPGDTISSPVTIAGLNNTFEGTVRTRVLGADRRVLADGFTTGTGGLGTWGPFRTTVDFAKGGDTAGYVVVFEDSPKDGTMINVVEVPVRFA